MRFRKLRIAWSVFWGLACVLPIVLWVRSDWWADAIWYRPGKTVGYRAMSDDGAVQFWKAGFDLLAMGDPPPQGWSWSHYWYFGYLSDVAHVGPWRKVFRGFQTHTYSLPQLPYWLPTLL